MPDGGGRGHFSSMAEMKAALEDHEKRILRLEVDVPQLADRVFTGRRVKRPRRPRSKPEGR